MRRKNIFSKYLLTAFGLGLIALLTLSFVLPSSTMTNAQERKPIQATTASSLAEAQASGMMEETISVTPVENDLATPEGGSCNWAADTVYPIPVLDQATVTLGNNLYSFGGVSTAIIATSYRYDGTTWTPIAPLPVALEFPQAVSDGTFIYILGGANSTGGSESTMYRYNPATNTYTTMAPFTTASWNHAAEFLNGKIYKFTGTAGTAGSTNVLEIYDVATNTWTLGAPYPISVSFVSSFVQGGFIYGAGGIASVGSVASNKTYRYNPATNTWDDAAIADLPATRWGAASSRTGYGSNNGWVLAGGYVAGTATANISNSVIRWDPATNTWTALPNMLQARARMTGGVLGANFHVIGGRANPAGGFAGTNDNQKLLCVSGVAVIQGGAATIVAENCGTPNNAPDPGETITVSLPLSNIGDTATMNLTATLQATGGVTNPTPASQNYGAVAPGAPVTRNFTFTVDPNAACGSTLTLTFVLTDGSTSHGTITRTFALGARPVLLSENFDGVTAPALPAGWTNVQIIGTATNWVTSTTTPNSPPNAAFANDPATTNLAALVSPAVVIAGADAQITFKNNYATENGFDGMVLEFSTNGGTTWTDIVTGGGSFASGGYNGTLSTCCENPLPGRQAWTGNSNGYVDTVVNLPASMNGQTVRFRWLMGSDNLIAATGVRIDDVQVLGSRVCQTCSGPIACRIQRKADFNGDGKTDYSVYRPGSGTWFVLPNGGGAASGYNFGTANDVLVPADYDGDGKTDYAVFRNGIWYWVESASGAVRGRQWGTATDIPVAGDYTGDGKADLAVYRPSNGVWYVLNLTNNAMTAVQWGGAASDVPVLGDFDGDCKMDYAVRRTDANGNTTFYILNSLGARQVLFGTSAMQMAIGDYNGDGKSDIGVVQNSGGVYRWHVINLVNFQIIVNGIPFGQTGDIITVGDYNGDGADDLSVYRPSNGVFYYRAVGNATQFGTAFGTATDMPVARYYQHPLP